MKIYKNVSEYIATASKPTQAKLKEMRSLIKKLVPQGKEAICYGMPTITVYGKNLVHFASMKGHLGFYPAPSGVQVVESELIKRAIKYSKGCIRFPYDTPLPVSLIKKVVTFRLSEETSKNKSSVGKVKSV